MGGFYRHGVHDRIDGHARKQFLLFKGYAQAVEGVENLRVYCVEALRSLFFGGSCVVDYGLEIDGGHVEVAPRRRRKRQPVAEGFQPEV